LGGEELMDDIPISISPGPHCTISWAWINVEDQLPPKDSTVLAWNGNYIEIVYYDGLKVQTLDAGDWNDTEITHWMPLPTPPKDR
jgi:Protein of unknown function (DUF551)